MKIVVRKKNRKTTVRQCPRAYGCARGHGVRYICNQHGPNPLPDHASDMKTDVHKGAMMYGQNARHNPPPPFRPTPPPLQRPPQIQRPLLVAGACQHNKQTHSQTCAPSKDGMLTPALHNAHKWQTHGGVFAQRGHSANDYVVYPGNTTENHPPTEACMIHSKQHRGCRIQDPGTRGKHQTKTINPWCTSGAVGCRI